MIALKHFLKLIKKYLKNLNNPIYLIFSLSLILDCCQLFWMGYYFLTTCCVYMTNIKELLGSNIKTYRRNLGISQAKLAEMVDMATNYLGLIEGGKKFPSADMIERIAFALGIDTPDLFTISPIQQEWKEYILLKMNTLLENELKTIRSGKTEFITKLIDNHDKENKESESEKFCDSHS